MAHGAGIPKVLTVSKEEDIADATDLIDQTRETLFVHLKVHDGPPAEIKRSLDAQFTKVAFRKQLLGHP